MESSERSHAWWIIATIAIGLYGALAVLIRVAPDNVIDQFVLNGVSGWDVPILDTTMGWVSWFTDLWPRLILGFIAIAGIALSGRYRLAALTAVVAAVTALPVNGLDLVGGFVADRIRPNGAPFLAYPSGHTLGTIVQFGFAIFLALRLGLDRRFLLPLVVLLALPIALVGPARILVGVHWSTDVLGAYLLGTATVITMVLLFEFGDRWVTRRAPLQDPVQSSLTRST